MPTLEINNLGGPLTRKRTGDIKSGLARFETSWGYDPYSKPGNLTWMEQPTSIASWNNPQDPLFTMKQRTESNINYVYGIGGASDLYKVTVNSTTNPNVDTASIIGDANFGSAIRGLGMAFHGSTEKIFMAGDDRIQKVNFDGSGASLIAQSLTSGPRPMTPFLGKLYFGNGNNIGEIDSTDAVTSVSKLSPALPPGLFIRDLDITPDGNYLQIVASRTNAQRVPGDDEDEASAAAADSYKFYWNGIDSSYSAQQSYSGLVLTTTEITPERNYTFGYDSLGAAIFQDSKKLISLPTSITPNFNSTFSIGNVLGFATAEWEESASRFRVGIYEYIQDDNDVPTGLFRLLRQNASVRDEVVAVTACLNVSNRFYQPSIWGFANNLAGVGKLYYSTRELNVGGSTENNSQKLWRFNTVPLGTQSIVAGTYETQTQIFSKKAKIGEVRLYTEPLIGGNDFVVDLIGSGGSVMAGGSQRFQVATGSVATGTDMVLFNPAMAPTYALGVRITNSSTTGVANWTANKVEVDYMEGGK